MPCLCFYVRQLGGKTDIPAKADNLFPHGFNDMAQNVRADVGFVFVHDFRVCPEFYKKLEDLPVASKRILHKGIELPVRKSTGAAFAELDIGFFIKFSGLPETPDGLLPLFDVGAPFENYRTITVAGQHQTAEKACGTASGDDDPVLLRPVPRFRKSVELRGYFMYIFISVPF